MTTTATIDNKARQVISNIRNLPTPPIVFHQIQKVIKDPKVNAAQVASILSEDPAMSVKVLKLTNSAFYGLSREIDSVKQAVVIVGMEAIKNLVLSASVLDMFKGQNVDQEFQDKFWRHSLAVAVCSRILARQLRAKGTADPDAAFSCGLLHDVGKIITQCFLPDEYKRVAAAMATDKTHMAYEIEEQVLGYNHTQIGALLAQQWKLPHTLSDAITYHHHPQLSETQEVMPYIVHLSNYLAKKIFYDRNDAHLTGKLEPTFLQYLCVSEADLEKYGEQLRDEYTRAETFMKMAGLN
jgi:putative nucleotidyltransferase with HDIG domain